MGERTVRIRLQVGCRERGNLAEAAELTAVVHSELHCAVVAGQYLQRARRVGEAVLTRIVFRQLDK